MARELQQFTGKVTFNTINLVSNGTKKIFNAYIMLPDSDGNESSYKVVSFRTQVQYQGNKLGQNGIKGKIVTFKGYFKENTYRSPSTFELMAEEMYIEGMEYLATEAANQDTVASEKPAGQLAPAGAVVQTAQPVAPNVQQPTQPTAHMTPMAPTTPPPNVQVIDNTLSQPAYQAPTTYQTSVKQGGPTAVAGGFIAPPQG